MTRGAVVAHVLGAITVVSTVEQAVASGGEGLLPWGLPILLLSVTTAVAGWLIAWRRPATGLGWILLAIPFVFVLQSAMTGLGELLAPGSPSAAAWAQEFGDASGWTWMPAIWLMLTQLPLRYPTGSLPSPRWRVFSWVTVALLVVACALTATIAPETAKGVHNPTFVPWGGARDLVETLGTLVLVPAIVGSLASPVIRYRRADAVVRAQLRWFFWAVAVVVVLLVGGWVSASFLPGEAVAIVSLVVGFTYSLIPLAVLFAVLRRGLFSIDRIISRTAAYALVTLLTVGTYVVVVVIASAVLRGSGQSGQTPPVAVAAATLAAAAVFLPILRRMRRRIDRVFNRSQYDAERVVAAFGEQIRNGADPHTAGADLVRAVEQSLDPAAVGLWVRP